MVLVLIVSALLFAVATFLTILLVTSRNSNIEPAPVVVDLPMQAATVMVNDVPVVINVDPEMEVMLATETVAAQPQQEQAQQAVPTITPTPTPVPPGPTQTPVPTPRPDPVIFSSHEVVAGNTLFSIANAYNTTVALMAKHGIDAADLIPGVNLAIPVPNPAYCKQGHRAYVVRDNDTVYSIAVQFGTTAEAIAQENGLGNNFRIEITQVICIPQ